MNKGEWSCFLLPLDFNVLGEKYINNNNDWNNGVMHAKIKDNSKKVESGLKITLCLVLMRESDTLPTFEIDMMVL